MKKLFIILAIMAFATAALAGGFLEKDGSNQNVIQGFAPNGKKSVAIGVVSQGVDMRQDAAWQVYAGAACKFRLQSTATKVGVTNTLTNAARSQVFYVNRATPFVNFTGCTSSELLRQ